MTVPSSRISESTIVLWSPIFLLFRSSKNAADDFLSFSGTNISLIK
jgi:hypothetical protein